MKTNNAKRILELGAGHGRDTIFFASNGIVEALEYL
jgi:predicted O-methyltransferase YrrM